MRRFDGIHQKQVIKNIALERKQEGAIKNNIDHSHHTDIPVGFLIIKGF